MNRNDRYAVRLGDAPPPVEYRSRDSEKRFTSTFLIILVSLLFVAVFGGALVGGVVSGDPSNRFFITIIAASGGAIGVAIIVSLRYVCLQRSAHKHREYAMKDPETRHVQQTFTRSVDEDEEVGYFDDRGRFYQGQGPVEENIREVKARAMTPGDVSAMSLASYDMESYTQATSHFTRGYNGNGYRLRINERPKEEYHDGPFDFSSVTSSKQNFPVREDPPEDGAGCNLYCGMPMSKDPSAAIATADGNILNEEDSDVDLNSPDAKSLSSRSAMSRYDVPDEELVVQDQEMDAFDVRSDIADDDRKEASKSQGKGSKRKVRTLGLISLRDCFPKTHFSLTGQ